MSATTRTFVAVWLEGGECPSDKRHFHGAAREVYGYMKFLGRNHGGFVFASVLDITEHTKIWADKNEKSFSQRQCERILRSFEELGVMDERDDNKILHGRKYGGWQLREHGLWTESVGGFCEFRFWEHYESRCQYIMGNQTKSDFDYQQLTEQNVGRNVGNNVGLNDGANVGQSGQNVGRNVGRSTDVLTPKHIETCDLHAEAKW